MSVPFLWNPIREATRRQAVNLATRSLLYGIVAGWRGDKAMVEACRTNLAEMVRIIEDKDRP